MRSWRLVSFLLTNYLLTTLPVLAAGCDLMEVKSSARLHDTLSRRAVEAVQLASQAGYQGDNRLTKLVEPSATFDLGAGDVGGPLGNGIEGVRSLAAVMHASSFRFDGWDYMDISTDGCGSQKVSVDFIDTPGKQSSLVEFTFDEGHIVSGKGWTRSFESGPLSPIEGRK